MSKKFKEYYDIEYAQFLGEKIKNSYPAFKIEAFLSYLNPTLEALEFNDRQVLS